MRRDGFDVSGWRRDVLASLALSPAVKVLCVVLADHMTTTGRVSVPRATLAARCGCSERQVSERFEKVVELRYLDRIASGQRQRTAVYQALRQTPFSARQNRPQNQVQRAVSPDAEPTVEPPAEISPLSVRPQFQRAVEPRASSKHTGTAAGRAACEPGTTQPRNDSGSQQPPPVHRAVAVDGAA